MAKDIKKLHRSPQYPGLTLTQAIEKAGKFASTFGGEEISVALAVEKAWGYSSRSSGGRTTIAALKAYGLMDDAGSNEDRRVSLTEEGLRITLGWLPYEELTLLLAECAKRPKIIQILIDQEELLLRKGRTLLSTDEEAVPRNLSNYLEALGYNSNSFADIFAVYMDARGYISRAQELLPGHLKDYSSHSHSGDIDLHTGVDILSAHTSYGEFKDSHRRVARNINKPPQNILYGKNNYSEAIREYNQNIKRNNLEKVLDKELGIIKSAETKQHFQKDVFSFSDGIVSITFPESLSEESFQDLTDWLLILHRRIGRRVKNPKVRIRLMKVEDENIDDLI